MRFAPNSRPSRGEASHSPLDSPADRCAASTAGSGRQTSATEAQSPIIHVSPRGARFRIMQQLFLDRLRLDVVHAGPAVVGLDPILGQLLGLPNGHEGRSWRFLATIEAYGVHGLN